MRFCVVYFALASPLLALTQSTAGIPETAVANAHLRGTIVCADTGKPARQAVVVADSIPSENAPLAPSNAHGATITSDDGTYSLDLPAGEYAVLIVYPGYLGGVQEVSRATIQALNSETSINTAERDAMSGRTITLGALETRQLNFSIERGAALSGSIRFADGSPASQVSLIFEREADPPPTDNASRFLENLEASVRSEFAGESRHSDDRGLFRLAGLLPGSYRLAILRPSQGAGRDGNEISGDQRGIAQNPYSTRFYAGNTVHAKSAKVFVVHAGEEARDILITIPLHAFHLIAGSIRAEDGRVPSAIVTLTDTADPSFRFEASTNNDGTFRFVQIPAGTYTLQTTRASFGTLVPNPYDPRSFLQKYTASFADHTRTFTVSSEDITNLDLTLKEVPLADELKRINGIQ